jgi:hypothetical protein
VTSTSEDGQAITVEFARARLSALSSLTGADVSGVMLIAQRRGDPAKFAQIRPTDRALPELNSVVGDAAGSYADSELIDYEPATSTTADQVMWMPAANVPLLESIASEAADMAGIPVFDPRHAHLGDLRLAALNANSNESTAVFVQNLRGNQIVAQSGRVGVVVRRGVLDVPPSGQILLFSRSVAAIVVDGVAFFADRAGFQRLFGYLDELRLQAEETFGAVTANLSIEGIEQMAAAVTGSPTMLGKMASIQRKLTRYPEYREALTMPKLVAFVSRHPECGVDLAGEGDSVRLVFRSDPQHRFKILKLLDDDYLRSELTTLEYEANSKSAPLG